MKTQKANKEKIKNLLSDIGYNENEIKKILDINLDDLKLSYFEEEKLDDEKFNLAIKFLEDEDSPKQLFSRLRFENKFLMIKIYNTYGNVLVDSIKLFRLLSNIANDYDINVLSYVYEKMFNPLNKEFIEELNNSYENKEDLYKKFNISKDTVKILKKD